MRRNIILGIESTFDNTGAAIINQNGEVLGESLITQNNFHTKTGGVEVLRAQQLHRRYLPRVVEDAMNQAGVNFKDIDAIATATKPGMYLCLKEGLEYSKQLVSEHKKPFIPINHMEAHLLTSRMIDTSLKFSFLTLLISGAHCLLCVASQLGSYKILGNCLDHPPGAAIDRVARRLCHHQNSNEITTQIVDGRNLEQLAHQGDRKKIQLRIPLIQSSGRPNYSCNFSFAGLLSNTMKIAHQFPDNNHYKDLAASFQHTLITHVCRQVYRSIQYIEQSSWFDEHNDKILVVSGGVACNSYLRKHLNIIVDKCEWKVIYPPHELCTDNGVMIAWAGLEYWREGRGISKTPLAETYKAKCSIGMDISKDVTRRKIKIPKGLLSESQMNPRRKNEVVP